MNTFCQHHSSCWNSALEQSLSDLEFEDLEEGEFRWQETNTNLGVLIQHNFEDAVNIETDSRGWEPPFIPIDECTDNEDSPSEDLPSEDEELPPSSPVTAVNSVSQLATKKQPADLPDPHDLQLRSSVTLPEDSQYINRPTLVLDLDETLVHCFSEPIPNPDMQFPVLWNGSQYQMYVRFRPHVDTFLKQVSKWFEVVVFTASSHEYADTVLDAIDPKGKLIHHRRFREACTLVGGSYLKDLRQLGRDLDTTCIVDNSPIAFSLQAENGVPIVSWLGSDDSDTELLKLLPFLRKLSHAMDVRDLIREQFSSNTMSN